MGTIQCLNLTEKELLIQKRPLWIRCEKEKLLRYNSTENKLANISLVP